MDAKVALLKAVPLFADLKDRELQQVSTLTDEVDMAAGRRLTREGDFGHEFFVIIDGRVSVERGGRHIADLGPGDFLGEIALVDGRPRTATVTAVGPVEALVIRRADFLEMIEFDSAVRLGILMALTERIRNTDPGHVD